MSNNGIIVEKVQENDPTVWTKMIAALLENATPDFILWTRTGWDWAGIGWSKEMADADQRRLLRLARDRKIPVVGYHLDIWFGLAREGQVATEPFFEVELLITADGGHDDLWKDMGVNHVWFPPAISRDEAKLGIFREEFASDVAFVGSHDGGYHRESEHRHALVQWLRLNFRDRCEFWPKHGQHAIRGTDLQDLYASAKVVVGDSCFTGTGLRRYVSDRLPESMGRGAYLLHPRVGGVTDGSLWQEGAHLQCWDAFDWNELGHLIESSLSNDNLRHNIAEQGRKHTLAFHTYEHRMSQLVDLLSARDMLGSGL